MFAKIRGREKGVAWGRPFVNLLLLAAVFFLFSRKKEPELTIYHPPVKQGDARHPV